MQGAQGMLVQNWPTVSSAAGEYKTLHLHAKDTRFCHSCLYISTEIEDKSRKATSKCLNTEAGLSQVC